MAFPPVVVARIVVTKELQCIVIGTFQPAVYYTIGFEFRMPSQYAGTGRREIHRGVARSKSWCSALSYLGCAFNNHESAPMLRAKSPDVMWIAEHVERSQLGSFAPWVPLVPKLVER